MIFTIMYYSFIVSAIFFYGIGLNDSTIICDKIHNIGMLLVKMLVSIVASVALCFLIQKEFLIPLGQNDFIPLIALLVYIIISVLFESIMRITSTKNTAEFNISYLIVLLALYESPNLVSSVSISIASFLSFAIILPVLYSIKKRIDIVGNIELHGNRRSLVLISLAILATLISVCNVSWLVPGVLP